MNYKNMTIDELRDELIVDGQKGYPFFLSGALYWIVMGFIGLIYESSQQLALFYLIGTFSIFPLAIAFSKILKVNILSTNPLAVLGGIIGGIQAFYIPVWVVIYIEQFELIPMSIGILGTSHFLPYLWIYRSKTYAVLTIAMALISFIFGYILIDQAFVLMPFLLFVVYPSTFISLKIETRTFINIQENKTISK